MKVTNELYEAQILMANKMYDSEYIKKKREGKDIDKDELSRLENDIHEKGEIENGILYWKMDTEEKRRVVPFDVAAYAYVVLHNKDIDMNEHEKARQESVSASLNEYREAHKDDTVSDEEREEMKAAFGEGTEVVNVITGATTTV